MGISFISFSVAVFLFSSAPVFAQQAEAPTAAKPAKPAVAQALPAGEKPKYGPEITLLSQAQDHVRKNPAPDFWALIPYYASQSNDASCSLASVAMVVNAARAGRVLGSEDELATQAGLLKRVRNPAWKRIGSNLIAGIKLEQLGSLVKDSLGAYGVETLSVEIVHIEEVSPETRARVHQALVESEKDGADFIIANFDQKIFTGDAQVGHVAPVGAYDAAKKRVLIFDPDRQWYEPYWVSEETFIRGMATRDTSSGKNRGFVRVRVAK